MPAVGAFKDAAAGQDESVIFIREIDVIDRVLYAQSTLDPICSAVISVSQKAVVARDPSTLRINETNCVEILATGTNATAYPSALRVNDNRRNDHHPADECQNDF